MDFLVQEGEEISRISEDFLGGPRYISTPYMCEDLEDTPYKHPNPASVWTKSRPLTFL